MEFDQTQIRLALDYAERARFQAKLIPTGEIVFERSPYPVDLTEELRQEIEFVADFYQRQIFQGDLDPEPENLPPGWPEFEDAVSEINYKLDRFMPEFQLEIKKTLGIEEPRQVNQYAQEMLRFHADAVKEKAKAK